MKNTRTEKLINVVSRKGIVSEVELTKRLKQKDIKSTYKFLRKLQRAGEIKFFKFSGLHSANLICVNIN